MDGSEFGERMGEIDHHTQLGENETAYQLAQALRTEVGAEAIVDGTMYGWAIYYELRALHSLERWADYTALMEAHEPMLHSVGLQNRAYASSLMMEALANSNGASQIPEWGVKTCHLRLLSEDFEAFKMAFRTTGYLLEECEQERLFEPFVRQLAGLVGEMGLDKLQASLLSFLEADSES